MVKPEIKGLFKGMGIALVVSSTIFYALILNFRGEMNEDLKWTDEEVIAQARILGMVFDEEIDMDEEDVNDMNDGIGGSDHKE